MLLSVTVTAWGEGGDGTGTDDGDDLVIVTRHLWEERRRGAERDLVGSRHVFVK